MAKKPWGDGPTLLANLHRAMDVCDGSYLKEEPQEVKHGLIT